MKQYLELIEHIKDYGDFKGDRTGVGTQSIFGYQNRYDLRKGFPLLTTKKLHFKSIAHELIWLLSGDTNIQYLKDNKVKIWDEWADENGDLGNVYGKQWRAWDNGDGTVIDQISNVIERIKSKPDCRRLIVNAWNPTDVPLDGLSFAENVAIGKGALPPCHAFFQFYTTEMHPNDREYEFRMKYVDKLEEWDLRPSEIESKMDELNFPTRYVDVQLYQRSADSFLGVPYNIASYSLLLMMVGQVVGMIPRFFIHSFGDVHIYNNHQEQTDLQLEREPLSLPKVELNPNIKNILDFKYKDIKLIGYEAHPHIKGEVAV